MAWWIGRVVAAELPDAGPRRHIPQDHLVVHRRGDDVVVVVRVAAAPHCAEVACERLHESVVLPVPDLHKLVVAGGDDVLAVVGVGEGSAEHRHGVTAEYSHFRSSVGVPHADGLIARCRGDVRSVDVVAAGIHLVPVALQRVDPPSHCHIPTP